MKRSVFTLLARRKAESLPSLASFCEKVVTKAVERAPSAKRSRRRLGIRKAAIRASSSRPAPRKVLRRISRTRPRMREAPMAAMTREVPLVLMKRP